MSSPTLALLRKDSLWLLGFLVGGCALVSNAFFHIGFRDAFIVPGEDPSTFIESLVAPASVLLAMCSALWDELHGAREYLAHRPITARRLFWTPHLAGLALIASWMTLGVVTVWLKDVLSPFGYGGAEADVGRLGLWATFAAGFWLDYAIVVFALALPTAWPHRIWLTALLLFTRYGVQSVLGAEDPSLGLVFALSVLGAAAFLLAAARCHRGGWDADHPTRGRVLLCSAPLALGAAGFFGATAASGWHELALDALQRARMQMGFVEPEELVLLRPLKGDDWEVCGGSGAPTGRTVVANQVHMAPGHEDPDFDVLELKALYPPFSWYQRMERNTRRLWVDRTTLHVFEETQEARKRWSLALPSECQAQGALLIELREGETHPVFLVGAEGAGPWLISTETPPRLVPAPLPDSDRAVTTTWHRLMNGAAFNAMRGRSQNWRFVDGQWLSAGPPSEGRAVEHRVVTPDPLMPVAELALENGPTLRHRYALEQPREKFLAGLAGLATVLRPAPFAIHSVFNDYAATAESKRDEALLLLDPLLGGGYRWLLGLNLALTAALMAWTFRDLRKRRTSVRRAACWALAVLAAGVFTGPILLALEPRRAWRRQTQTTPATPLIASV
jgi:hypothetical protein